MSNSIANRLLMPCIILLLLLLAACHNPSPWGRQGETADSLIEQHPDSVLLLLQDVDYNALDEEGQAHYGLLLTAARYKLYQPVDTTFINRSIDYYSSHLRGDKRGWGSNSSPLGGDKRGASLYYKAVVLYDLGKKQEATLLLKQAEQQAERSDDELLRNKIYENLEMVNSDARLYQLALRYAKKFVKSSCRLHDTLCIMRSLDHQAVLYNKLGYVDSMRAIYDRLVPIMKSRRDSDVAYILGNMANCQMTFHQYDKVRATIGRAMQIKPLVSHYMILGRLAKMEGDTATARERWEKVLTYHIDEYDVKANLAIAQLYHQRGDFRHEAELLEKVNSHLRSQNESTLASRLMEEQQRYDQDRLTRSQNAWIGQASLLVVLAFIMLVFVFMSYRRLTRRALNKRVRALAEANSRLIQLKRLRDEYREQYQAALSSLNQLKNEQEAQISLLGQKASEAERERQQLEKWAKSAAADVEKIMLNGASVYKDIVGRKLDIQLSKRREQDFVNYFQIAHCSEYAKATAPYPELPLRLNTYLVLTTMGVTSKEMETILNVSTSAIKSYRHRLKELKRLPSEP